MKKKNYYDRNVQKIFMYTSIIFTAFPASHIVIVEDAENEGNYTNIK